MILSDALILPLSQLQHIKWWRQTIQYTDCSCMFIF